MPFTSQIYSDSIIYDEVGQIIPEDRRLLGIPVLCDFGEPHFEDPIQPFMFQWLSKLPGLILAMGHFRGAS